LLLIDTDDDEYFDQEYITEMKTLFPSPIVHIFRNYGHLISLVRGKLFVDLILRFILDEDTYTTLTSRTDGSEDAPVIVEDTLLEEEAPEHENLDQLKHQTPELKRKKGETLRMLNPNAKKSLILIRKKILLKKRSIPSCVSMVSRIFRRNRRLCCRAIFGDA